MDWQAPYLTFHCPRWDEISDQGLFSREVVEYIENTLSPILPKVTIITPTMIQNYSKWGAIPELKGRKYYRIHIAYLIIITIYKQILNIEDVKKGVQLQLDLTGVEQGYDLFAQSLEQALASVFGGTNSEDHLVLARQQVMGQAEGVQVVSNAFALKLLGTLIIDSDGYERIGVKDE